VALVLALGATLPVAVVRAQATAAALAVTAAVAAGLALGRPAPVAAVVALGWVAGVLARAHPWRAAGLTAAALAGAVALVALVDGGPSPLAAGLPVAALAVGSAVGALRRSRAVATERRTTERAIADTLMDHVARGERARIARELHDVVAHHISMIAVQAETARLATPGMPPEGAERLLAIGDTARAALTEMRRLLGVLRDDAGAPAAPGPDTGPDAGSGAAARAPQPGLEQLNELIDEARASGGASTRLIVRGPVAPMAPGLELTAFRIVQEALTNARRHAPGAAVDVEVRYAADALHLRVRDNGPGPRPGGAAGHGVTGMRERAATLGGTLRAGAGRDCGFLVEATLPRAGAE
jgi:signal transduction histidine kinase